MNEERVSRRAFVNIFWKYGYTPEECLQIPLGDRCQYLTDIKDKLAAMEELRLLLHDRTRESHDFAHELACLWRTKFENPKTPSARLGARLALFLELITESGLPDVVNLVTSKIDGERYLRHADRAHLSNLLATHIKSFVYSKKDLMDQEHDFFRNVVNGKPDEVLSIFGATVEKLESADVVLCFWLFLIGEVRPHQEQPRSSKELQSFRRQIWEKAQERMGPRSLKTIMYFLASHPHTTIFFRHLHQAMLAFARKDLWEEVWVEASRYDLYVEFINKVQMEDVKSGPPCSSRPGVSRGRRGSRADRSCSFLSWFWPRKGIESRPPLVK